MMNLALNQVLARSINTTITSVLPVLSMLIVGSFILGATTLQEFSIALLVGLIVGGYSSIFVASLVVAYLKEREPEYQQIAKKVAKKSGDESGTRWVSAEDATFGIQAGRMRKGTATKAKTPTKTRKPAASKETVDGDGVEAAPKAKQQPSKTAPGAIPPRPRKTKRKK
jgi:preprotein translocase subunit SecF